MRRKDYASTRSGHKIHARLVEGAATSSTPDAVRAGLAAAPGATRDALTAALSYHNGLLAELLRLMREQGHDVDAIVQQIQTPTSHHQGLKDFDRGA